LSRQILCSRAIALGRNNFRIFLQAGLDKLAEAAGKVGELSQQAAEQQVLLTQKQTEAEAALVQITDSMARAGDSKAEIERLRVKLAAEEQVLNGRKEGIQAELSEIQPLIDSAKKAVGQIKNDNLNEIRSLKMPPDAIRDVLEGVLLLMGNYDTSWTNMKKFLGSKSVKDEIVNFDARKVTPDMRASVQKLLAAKGASFEHERVRLQNGFQSRLDFYLSRLL
jgi:dynein heavy chain 2